MNVFYGKCLASPENMGCVDSSRKPLCLEMGMAAVSYLPNDVCMYVCICVCISTLIRASLGGVAYICFPSALAMLLLTPVSSMQTAVLALQCWSLIPPAPCFCNDEV